MDHPASDLDIHRDHLGFSQKVTDPPSRQKNGKLQTHDCYTPHQLTDPCAQPKLDHTTTVEEDEFWPLSDKPYFHFIVSSSNVKQSHQLRIPSKIHQILPQAKVPVVLTCRNKSWNMMYYGDGGDKRFNPGWRKFLVDNKLKVGDGCVFELTECSNECIKFRVRILSGEIPCEFEDRVEGMSSFSPIVID